MTDDVARTLARHLGICTSELAKDGVLRADWIETSLGPMLAVSDPHALHLLEFAERRALAGELKRLWAMSKGHMGVGRFAPTDRIEAELAEFYAGHRARFDVALAPLGTPLHREVWTALQAIPMGQTLSYGALAARMGRAGSARAVARANGANPVAVVIPCHRLIGADGALTGYGGGLWRKDRLLELERGFARGATKG